ncbi:bifunctional diguanylate cyclase/phosphodiesterase [Aquabacterium sp. A08]|uniref:putative bifunctional diguanylate cyclase/phosphodiesterase n=1 Tax=Aquabacterium sp. A08 TaxID=2718532 RepID=UPI001420244D|nr:bifunctional diguanylate cyclase/phosphodiesterase [Aquabacterium sp. A08]NIC42320.1 EAL domain-containing protein [Aquabacterium sp. A08]
MDPRPEPAPAPAPLPAVRLDLAGFITGWNDAASAFFGFSAAEALGQHLLLLCGPADGDFAELAPPGPGATPASTTVWRRTKAGQPVQVALTLRLDTDADGDPTGLCAEYRPLERPLSAADRLRLCVSLVEHSHQGVMVTDAHGQIVMVNAAFSRITGHSAADALGQTADLLGSGRDGDALRTQVQTALQGAGLWLGEVLARRRSGELVPLSVCISTVRDAQGQATHAFSIFSDIGHPRDTEVRRQHLANVDHISGLPNRLLLGQLLGQALSQAKRDQGLGAVLVVQLQRLGWIYDTLGHEVGDELVAQAGQRLQQALREQDILARLGHDKLAVALPNMRQREHAGLVAHKLLALLRPAYVLHGVTVDCPVSVGIALYPDNGMETAALLRCAELANQRVDDPNTPICYFSPEMNERATERFRIEGELRHAMAHGELCLYHQPKVSLRTGRIVGAEALVRWQHPQRGLLGPGHFVPVAEDSGLIRDLGDWVLHEACRQLRDWQAQGLSMPPLAVNLSARQFDKYLPKRLDALLAMHDLAPQQLKLEITESLMVRGADEVVPIMNELAAMGLGIALDDFGTGYSSLAYLKKFPITTLKIDRSFVTGIPQQNDDCAIARAIVTMGQQMRQEIVAEGVETREQMAFLRALGCDQLQGYLFSPPVPADAYERLVRDDIRLPLD